MKKLGFGCMRLPILEQDNQSSFDFETIKKLFDTFIEKGFTYFDTAYTYHNYHGEEAVKEALVKRHPRNTFQLATKLPLRDINSYEEMEKVFEEQLEHCGVTYFDYYLLHNIGAKIYQKVCEIKSFEFGLKKKMEGKIKQFGFSFHDTPELLDEILTAYPEVDFVQLQINYIDWENPSIQSKGCYEVARRHKKPIIVMEPCKGGTLAFVPEKAEEQMRKYNSQASVASWAIRYAASQDGVIMVLSGMNTIEQLLDNTSYMANFHPMKEEEYQIIQNVIDIIHENTAIPCTNCRYCEKGCPKKIAIPDYFSLYNSAMRATTSNFSSQLVYYLNFTANHGKAGDCIGCKQCENACPQHLKIISLLKEVSAKFDSASVFPVRK